MNKLITTALLTLTLFGCASHSGYKAANGSGYGYSESEISENRYRIDYRARSHQTSKAKNYALLRAAELTQEKGYDWFVVVDRESRVEKSVDRFDSRVQQGQTVTKSCGLLGCTTSTQPTSSYAMGVSTGNGKDEALISIEVRMGKGVKPTAGDVYDSTEVQDSLGKKR